MLRLHGGHPDAAAVDLSSVYTMARALQGPRVVPWDADFEGILRDAIGPTIAALPQLGEPELRELARQTKRAFDAELVPTLIESGRFFWLEWHLDARRNLMLGRPRFASDSWEHPASTDWTEVLRLTTRITSLRIAAWRAQTEEEWQPIAAELDALRSKLDTARSIVNPPKGESAAREPSPSDRALARVLDQQWRDDMWRELLGKLRVLNHAIELALHQRTTGAFPDSLARFAKSESEQGGGGLHELSYYPGGQKAGGSSYAIVLSLPWRDELGAWCVDSDGRTFDTDLVSGGRCVNPLSLRAPEGPGVSQSPPG